jgi:hypothetical protein
MTFPESVFGFNKLGNQDLFVRGHAGVQANDANSQETKSEISLDMLVQGQKGEQHEIGGSDTSDAVIERHGSLDSKARSGETLETQELTSVDFVWADGKNDGMNENDRSSMLYLENENFELWKIVKDGLVLPLLIDICKKVGLFLPPCLMRLPTELKLKILESLAAIDIAKMESVSSEMQCLSSNNDPWQQKFVEEFGDGTGALGTVNWKEQFASYWENKKKRKRDVNAMARLSSSSALFLPNQEKFCLVFLHPMVVLVKDFLDFVEILLEVVMRLKRDLQQEKHNPRELQERHRKWIPHLLKKYFVYLFLHKFNVKYGI